MKKIKSLPSQLNRRELIQAGLIGGAGLLLPLKFSNTVYAGESPTLTHFKDALPLPGVIQPGSSGNYEVQMAQTQQILHSDIGPTTVWGYGDANGVSFPGPTFETLNGEDINVTWINNLATNPNERHFLDIDPSALAPNIHGATDNRKAVVHVHGGHIPAAVDGDPKATLLPGEQTTYKYPIRQQASTLWYHDHSLGITRLNVYMGLAGFFLVRDQNEINMMNSGHLPSGEYEIPLVLQDRVFKENGEFSYDAKFDDMFLGDVLLVNGKVWPYLNVERRKYRFRVLNGSNSRAYTLQLPDNRPFYQIGTDGGFLPNPIRIYELTLTPGERADIIIDFSQFAGGDDVILTNIAPPMFGHPKEAKEKFIRDVLQFKVQHGTVADDAKTKMLLELLPGGIPEIPLDNALLRKFKLDDTFDSKVGESKWLINGLGYEEITENVSAGAVEIWRFINKSSHLHPMHLHLVQFQVLSRTNKKGKDLGLDANEMGWKDTVRVGGKEIVTVATQFPSSPDLMGKFPYHCHILEHEDHEMMRQFSLS